MITGKVPYDDLESLKAASVPKLREEKLRNEIARGTLPPKPVDLEKTKCWLWDELCEPCWNLTPAKRLSAHDAVTKLKQPAGA